MASVTRNKFRVQQTSTKQKKFDENFNKRTLLSTCPRFAWKVHIL